ncbi:hypothetical protein FNH22_04020 [Fulvivirga sp. M361]|uniref:hypothetical protein n=1 Tax=Fulvivirga sp. M361 TaxID=2594266 RepID=UPI00117B1433|nr:hypothetical protein [Fulvivirga sp. M361]TRX61230.1 hypothetical protein FNH22_04020 [Fulvivirga sp. M361]
MLGWFKKKDKKDKLPQLMDLNSNPIQAGDIVEALRYDLGRCELILVNEQFLYRSIESGKEVSWLKMIDASTDNQKVKKVED